MKKIHQTLSCFRVLSTGLGLILAGFLLIPNAWGADSPPHFSQFNRLPDGRFVLTLQGQAGMRYAIETSSDLTNWLSLMSIVATNGVNSFTNSPPSGLAMRFYRSRLEPQAPVSLAGFEINGTVSSATGSFTEYYDPSPETSTGIRQFDRFTFDRTGSNYYHLVHFDIVGGMVEQVLPGTYNYSAQSNAATVSLTVKMAEIEYDQTLLLTFLSSDSGTFRADYTAGGTGTLTGLFNLQPVVPQTLQNGVAVTNISGIFGQQKHYKISVPAGQNELAIRIFNAHNSGNHVALFVRHGLEATYSYSDYELDEPSPLSPDFLTIRNPAAGDWYFLLSPSFDYTNVSLQVNYTTNSTCVYDLSSDNQSFGASGGTNSVNVEATNGCTWTAASAANWILITSETNSFGNKALTYSVAANTSTNSRTGILTIAGQTLTVTQAAGSGGPDLAPASISGRTVFVDYTSGGTDAFHFVNGTNFTGEDFSGTYTYTKTSSTTATSVLTATTPPFSGRIITIGLTFGSATTGMFSYNGVGGGFPADSGSGTFTVSP